MAHHHMIQYPGADHVQSVLEDGGQGAISLTGLWIAGGMIVNHNDGRSVVFQGDLDHFSWVHTGPIQRASEQFSKAYNSVFGIEQQQSEDFVLMVLQQCLQVVEHLLRLSQCPAFRQTTHGQLLRHLKDVGFGDW